MKKFKLKKRRVKYKGQVYHKGSVIEMKEFDNSLPSAWFEEMKEEKKIKPNKEVIKNVSNNNNTK